MDDPPVVQDDGSITQGNPPFYVMRDEDAGLIVRVHPGQDPVKRGAGMLIQTGIGLVQKKDGRIVDERTSDGQALLHPAGKGPYPVMFSIGQSDLFEQAGYSVLRILGTVHFPEEPEVLCGRQFWIQIRFMGDDTDFLPDLDGVHSDINAIDHDLSVGGAYQGGQDLDEGGLSCTVGPEYREKLPFLDIEIDISQDNVRPEYL